jgi:hypothetical protein
MSVITLLFVTLTKNTGGGGHPFQTRNGETEESRVQSARRESALELIRMEFASLE